MLTSLKEYSCAAVKFSSGIASVHVGVCSIR